MDQKVLKQIIKTGESEFTEFKLSFSKEVIISLVAFANSKGGKVILGLDDSGKIKGLSIEKETLQNYLNEIKQTTYPQLFPNVEVEKVRGKSIIVFDIKEFPVQPVAYKNRYYKRVKNSNHILTLDEIVNLQQQSLNISYDSYPVNKPLSSLNIGLVEEFLEKTNSKGRINLGDDIVTNLTKLRLIKEGKPTLASVLLFGDHDYAIHIGRFKSADVIIDDLLLKQPLMEALQEAAIFIKKHINLAFEFDGELERKEKWQYPLEAIRELLLNCVVHRDYKSTSDIVIKIFDDRISFTNPGRLYGNITVADLQRDDYISSLRNKLLAEMFYLMGDIEKYGTGLIRIRRILRDIPDISLNFEEMGDFFKVDLLKTPLKEESKNGLLTNLERKILEEVKKDEKITTSQMGFNLKVSRDTVREYIKRLKDKGVLKRMGSRRNGCWELIE